MVVGVMAILVVMWSRVGRDADDEAIQQHGLQIISLRLGSKPTNDLPNEVTKIRNTSEAVGVLAKRIDKVGHTRRCGVQVEKRELFG